MKAKKAMPGRSTVPVNLRVKPELRERIQAAANANGRKITPEIILRLEASLAAAEARDHTHVPGLLAVAAAMNAAGQQAAFASTFTLDGAQRWWNDPYAFDQAVRAANRIFEAMRPPGKIDPPPGLSGMAGTLDMGMVAQNFGVGYANGILSEIASDEPTSTTPVSAARIIDRSFLRASVRLPWNVFRNRLPSIRYCRRCTFSPRDSIPPSPYERLVILRSFRIGFVARVLRRGRGEALARA